MHADELPRALEINWVFMHELAERFSITFDIQLVISKLFAARFAGSRGTECDRGVIMMIKQIFIINKLIIDRRWK